MPVPPPPLETTPAVSAPEPAPVNSLPTEFGIGEADQPPRLVRKVEPVYPYRAKVRNIQGKVVVTFLVSPSGYVEKPRIVSANPKGVFEKSALQAIRQWRFEPGIYQGKPVAIRMILPIKFNLH